MKPAESEEDSEKSCSQYKSKVGDEPDPKTKEEKQKKADNAYEKCIALKKSQRDAAGKRKANCDKLQADTDDLDQCQYAAQQDLFLACSASASDQLAEDYAKAAKDNEDSEDEISDLQDDLNEAAKGVPELEELVSNDNSTADEYVNTLADEGADARNRGMAIASDSDTLQEEANNMRSEGGGGEGVAAGGTDADPVTPVASETPTDVTPAKEEAPVRGDGGETQKVASNNFGDTGTGTGGTTSGGKSPSTVNTGGPTGGTPGQGGPGGQQTAGGPPPSGASPGSLPGGMLPSGNPTSPTPSSGSPTSLAANTPMTGGPASATNEGKPFVPLTTAQASATSPGGVLSDLAAAAARKAAAAVNGIFPGSSARGADTSSTGLREQLAQHLSSGGATRSIAAVPATPAEPVASTEPTALARAGIAPANPRRTESGALDDATAPAAPAPVSAAGSGTQAEALNPFAKPLGDPKFSLMGSETDQIIKKMLGEIDTPAAHAAAAVLDEGVGDRNGPSLFERAHRMHETSLRKGRVRGIAIR